MASPLLPRLSSLATSTTSSSSFLQFNSLPQLNLIHHNRSAHTTNNTIHLRTHLHVVCATTSDESESNQTTPTTITTPTPSTTGKEEDVIPTPLSKQSTSSSANSNSVSLTLEDVNPVGLGRRSRQLFDDVWRRFTELGQLTRSPRGDEEFDGVLVGGPMCEFTIPGADTTTVLVAGATSRVGRIVIRKLQLRGYKVKALVRNADPEIVEMLPRSVQIAVGDVGEPSTLKNAVEGCNKIIFCARARSNITGDLNRVDRLGVYNLAKAFQDYNHRLAQARAGRSSKSKLLISKFSQPKEKEAWTVLQGTYFTDDIAVKFDGGMSADLQIGEDGNAVFSGYVFTRGGYVEMVKKLSFSAGISLDRYEGLVLSVCGDGKVYSLILEACSMDDPSHRILYFSRFTTRIGYSRVRVPFSSFRPVNPEDPALDPFSVHTLTIRFEPRKQRPPPVRSGSTAPTTNRDNNSFKLVIDYIKALPGGQETDFVLLSCTGAGLDDEEREKVLKVKQVRKEFPMLTL